MEALVHGNLSDDEKQRIKSQWYSKEEKYLR
jgi:hypothetical protein